MSKSLVILNSLDNLDDTISSLGLSGDTVEIIENDYPIVVQPFDNLIRSILIKITRFDVKDIYFVIDQNKLEDSSMLEWLNEPRVQESIELFDYLKLPGTEATQTWFKPTSLDAELDKSITLLKKHPLLPKDVNYSFTLIEKN